MTRILKVVAAIIICGHATPAFAGDLTTDQARRFAESLPAATELGQELEAKGLDEVFDKEPTFLAGEEFRMYSSGVELLKKDHAAEYSQLTNVVKKHGFTNGLEWARVGDKAMLAYIALKTPPMADAMADVSPELLKMLPPEQRVQFERGKAMIAAIDAVPEADKEAVRPVLALLDEMTLQSGQKAGAFTGR
ncbi:MAG: hypothetical protein AAFY22_05475 [Pseudomonadota bacterium]